MKIKAVCREEGAHLYCLMEKSVILFSSFVTSICGNNAEAAPDKCIPVQVFI